MKSSRNQGTRGGGGGGEKEATRFATDKRCSHNLLSVHTAAIK